MTQGIVLASSSIYRRTILERTGLEFNTASPDIDETPHAGESPENLVTRLAKEKAGALTNQHPDALLIGSDQVADLNGSIVGKPSDFDAAFEQLTKASGNKVTLVTSVALLNSRTGNLQCGVDRFEVTFRKLNSRQISNYIEQEQPYDCCGSLRAEGPGIALLERLHGDDPNTLIGLPLIQLIGMLESEGVTIF